jgi:hypothetical protein
MLWEIARWVCFLLVMGFVLTIVFDIFAFIDRLLTRQPSSADHDVYLMYHEGESKSDPTAPPIIEYPATRNARQRRG